MPAGELSFDQEFYLEQTIPEFNELSNDMEPLLLDLRVDDDTWRQQIVEPLATLDVSFFNLEITDPPADSLELTAIHSEFMAFKDSCMSGSDQFVEGLDAKDNAAVAAAAEALLQCRANYAASHQRLVQHLANLPAAIGALAPTATTAPIEAAPPTPTPELAPTQAPASGSVIIAAVHYSDEYVELQNTGSQPQDLSGWRLLSERGAQDCMLSGVIDPGEVMLIWARSEDAGNGGFNCGFGSNIWNNDEDDPAVLFDAYGNQMSRK
jgi:hypothetical protein